MTHGQMRDTKEEDMVERIKAIPRYAPRLVFRLKVFLVATLPTLEYSNARRRGNRNGWGPRVELSGHGRLVAVGAMALVVAFLIFSSLVLVSGNSLPGSPLYSLKRAREQLGLAMTWGNAGKAQRHLALASSRLSELDSMAVKGEVDPDSVEGLAKDYNSDTAAVAQILAQDPGSPGAKEIARSLQALQTQKTNMVRRLSTESPSGVLASADGATVKVSDTASKGVLGATGQVEGITDNKGDFRFDVNTTDRTQLTALDAVIEKDGRKATVPVFAAAKGNDNYSVRVEPDLQVVELNQPVRFSLSVSRKDGATIGQRRLKLTDSSQTSLIDGKLGEAITWADVNGSCTFTLTKTIDTAVSRISLQVEEGGWVSAGQVLAVGAIEGPEVSKPTSRVSATGNGSSTSPQSVELNNGLVRVTARKSYDGEVLRSVVRSGGATEAGPLYDPLPLEARSVNGQVTVDGPRIAFANDRAAGYEITFDMAVSGGAIRKAYQVILTAGDPFAAIKCNVTVSGKAVELVKDHPALVATDGLKRPAGATLEVGGQKSETAQKQGQTTLFSFQIGNPYVVFRTGSGIVFAAYPIDSETYPETWSVSSDSVTPTTNGVSHLTAGGFKTMMVLGVAENGDLDAVISRARGGIGDPSACASSPAVESNNGFTVLTVPGIEQLGKGKQQLTLKVLKQYELVFQKFQ